MTATACEVVQGGQTMADKTCTRCGETKPETDFRINVKATGHRIALCHPCDVAYRAERWKKADKSAKKIKMEEHKARRAALVTAGTVIDPISKVCIECQRDMPIDEFRWRNKAMKWRQSLCRECDVDYRAKNYVKNPAMYMENNKRTQSKLKVLLNEMKSGPCVDCKQSYPPYVMDFDHLDPKTKVVKVSALIFEGSRQLLLDEIAKCELVCANCHRERTHQRKLGKTKRNNNGHEDPN